MRIFCAKCATEHPVTTEDLPVTCQCGHVLEAKNIHQVNPLVIKEDQRVFNLLLDYATTSKEDQAHVEPA